MGWFNSIFNNKESLKKYAEAVQCPDCGRKVAEYNLKNHQGSTFCKDTQENDRKLQSTLDQAQRLLNPSRTFNSAEGVDANTLEQFHKKLIGSAIDQGHEVKFDYAKPNSEPEERNVIPGSIGGEYFKAFCLDRQAWRQFKLDRIIGKVKGTKPASLTPPPDPEPIPQARPTAPGLSRVDVKKPANEGANPDKEIHELFGVGGTNRNSALVNIFGRFTSHYPKNEDGSTPTGNEIELKNDRRNLEDDQQFLAEHEHDNNKPDRTVEPTQPDYDEIRKLDIDPDTHDKATYKRIRSMGVPHHKCVAAAADGIPMEDFELALQNNEGDASKAHQEALKYHGYYDNIIAKNRAASLELNKLDPKVNPLKAIGTLDDDTHDQLISEIFAHHFTLRNEPEHRGAYPNVPGRERANEWIMNECTKILPGLKRGMSRDKQAYSDDSLLPSVSAKVDPGSPKTEEGYSHKVNKLINHYTMKNTLPQTRKDYIVNSRKLKALSNIANSKWYPNDYSYDKYEEENV